MYNKYKKCTMLISSPDLDLAVRGQQNRGGGRGEGKGEEETRSGKIRIETSADWLFHNACESYTHVLFLSLAVPKMISSPDLVLAVQGQKNRGGGEGKGEEETRSGKIRLRRPESGPRVNCACPKSDML